MDLRGHHVSIRSKSFIFSWAFSYFPFVSSINALPAQAQAFLQEVEQRTGLSGSFIFGGPIPAADGMISTARYCLCYRSFSHANTSTVSTWGKMLSAIHLVKLIRT
jgi:hypothetical protein